VLIPYRQAHPEVSIFFKECLLDDLNQRLSHEQIDFSVIPSNISTEQQQNHFFYAENLYYLPQESGSNPQKVFQYRINELPEAQVILTGGGCGLNGYLEHIFKQEKAKLQSYPGQALSYKVIEEWASLGIGAGILPKAKISTENKMARPLLLSNGQMASFSYEWVWRNDMSARQDMVDFIDYITNTIPALIRGEQQLAAA
uniref:LysR substrate-binding domain-containing protein n=1 Tax=Candidatus Albibeggiatoa sp. nov. BB20 TaxID=3162723 RepID=UPI003365B1FF